MTDNKRFGISEQLDTISRAAVLDEIHKYMEERDYTIGTLYDNICELPSVQSGEPSHDAVKEYCRKRCMSIVDTALLEKYVPSAQSTMGQVNQGDTVNERAVKFLDLFAKTYCRDKSVTDDLKFRCSECEFEMPDKKCLVKCMAQKLCPDYKDFGSMGRL